MFHRVLVAGIGALGSELVKNLGLLGCESVFLADADIIEEKNMHRSLLMRDGIPGASKVAHAIERLKNWFPHTEWDGASVEIADVETKQFLHTDVIFSCVDTDLARAEIAVLAARYKLPVCDGGLGGTSTQVGRASWFPADQTAACFGCLLNSKRRGEILSVWESNIHSCWANGMPEQPTWTSTPTMTSIVAALQIETAASAQKHSFSIQIDLDREPMMENIQHRRSADCPFHDEVEGIAFPICTLAECRHCGQQFSPYKRIAWLRRWGSCPVCGGRDIAVRTSTIEELTGSAL